jgi:hypothetical protein
VYGRAAPTLGLGLGDVAPPEQEREG